MTTWPDVVNYRVILGPLTGMSMTQDDKQEYNMIGTMSVEDAAKEGRYNLEYIRQLVRQGKIQARKIGRVWFINRKSFQDYIDRNKR